MKEKVLFTIFIFAIVVSVFFTYQRSFVWKNFDLINSEEETEESVDETALDEDAEGEGSSGESTETDSEESESLYEAI